MNAGFGCRGVDSPGPKANSIVAGLHVLKICLMTEVATGRYTAHMESLRPILLKTIFAILFLPPLVPIVFYLVMINVGLWRDDLHLDGRDKYWSLGLSGIVACSYLGTALVALPGIVAAFLLQLKKYWHFIVIGMLAGILTCLFVEEILPVLDAYRDNRIESNHILLDIFSFANIRAYPLILLQFAASGITSAFIFWLFVRPDRYSGVSKERLR